MVGLPSVVRACVRFCATVESAGTSCHREKLAWRLRSNVAFLHGSCVRTVDGQQGRYTIQQQQQQLRVEKSYEKR